MHESSLVSSNGSSACRLLCVCVSSITCTNCIHLVGLGLQYPRSDNQRPEMGHSSRTRADVTQNLALNREFALTIDDLSSLALTLGTLD